MDAIIYPSIDLSGEVTAPSSKSHMLRALWMALLAQEMSVIDFPLDSKDTQDTIRLMRGLGAKVDFQENQLIIDSRCALKTSMDSLFSGDSGISTRFVLPILGLRENVDSPIILDCSHQMRARPMQSLIQALNQLGMQIESVNSDSTLPIRVSGKLMGGQAMVSGITSQFISALLMALPNAQADSLISIENLCERPYVEMTLSWLQSQSIHFSHEKTGFFDTFFVKGNQRYRGFCNRISGDYSQSAAILVAAMMTHGVISIKNLNREDVQGDKKILALLKQLGAHIRWSQHDVLEIQPPTAWDGFIFDANDTPDLVPILAVLATQAKTASSILNVPQARLKECDRLHAITHALTQMGAHIVEMPDGLQIQPSPLQGAVMSSYGDHRMVMALTVAGFIANGKTIIQDAECIEKTFPNFFACMRQLGAHIELRQ